MPNTPVAMFALLNGVPTVDVKKNLRIALNSRRRTTAVLQAMSPCKWERARSPRPDTFTTILGPTSQQGAETGLRREAGAASNARRLQ
jgi:hypothetical protein